jgi:hypothetical protein
VEFGRFFTHFMAIRISCQKGHWGKALLSKNRISSYRNVSHLILFTATFWHHVTRSSHLSETGHRFLTAWKHKYSKEGNKQTSKHMLTKTKDNIRQQSPQ